MEAASFEKLVIKKVLCVYMFFSIIILVITSEKSVDMLAFSTGTILGCLKLLIMGKLSTNIVTPERSFKLTLSSVIYLMAILIFYGLIVLSAVNGVRFFIFFTSGVLLINFVVFANSILELLGIIKTNS